METENGMRVIGPTEPVKCGVLRCSTMVVGVRYCEAHRHFVDTLTITTTHRFRLRDRLRLLFGWRMTVQHKLPIIIDRNVAMSPPVAEPTTWYTPPFQRRQQTVGALQAPRVS